MSQDAEADSRVVECRHKEVVDIEDFRRNLARMMRNCSVRGQHFKRVLVPH